MKQQMYAELLFDHPDGRDLAIVELAKLGFEVEILPWVDEHEKLILTPTVWIKVRGDYEGGEDAFFRQMEDLVAQFSGDVVEAGLADDPQQAA